MSQDLCLPPRVEFKMPTGFLDIHYFNLGNVSHKTKVDALKRVGMMELRDKSRKCFRGGDINIAERKSSFSKNCCGVYTIMGFPGGSAVKSPPAI